MSALLYVAEPNTNVCGCVRGRGIDVAPYEPRGSVLKLLDSRTWLGIIRLDVAPCEPGGGVLKLTNRIPDCRRRWQQEVGAPYEPGGGVLKHS